MNVLNLQRAATSLYKQSCLPAACKHKNACVKQRAKNTTSVAYFYRKGTLFSDRTQGGFVIVSEPGLGQQRVQRTCEYSQMLVSSVLCCMLHMHLSGVPLLYVAHTFRGISAPLDLCCTHVARHLSTVGAKTRSMIGTCAPCMTVCEPVARFLGMKRLLCLFVLMCAKICAL